MYLGKRLGISLFLLLLCGVVSARVVRAAGQAENKVPDFELKDQAGEMVRLSDMRGHAWIANFIFTRCGDICPLMSERMKTLQNRITDRRVRFISFTVDPDHDTPEVLAAYAKRYDAEVGRWFFLTGERAAIWEKIAPAFRLPLVEATDEEQSGGAQPFIHSDRFTLVDGDGLIRGHYDSSEAGEMDGLARQAVMLQSLAKGSP
jgi:protein SCO1/2